MTTDDTTTNAASSPLDGTVRPCCFWRREWAGDDSDLGAYVYAEELSDIDDPDQWEPLYDSEAMAAIAIASCERYASALRDLRDVVIDQNRRGTSWHPELFGRLMNALADANTALAGPNV